MVNVSWNDAVEFAQWLIRKDGKTYQLPTEAEWEYACRRGHEPASSNGDDTEGLAVVGYAADGTAKDKYPNWTSTIAVRDDYVYTSPMGWFQRNEFGLYNMHGNVWEWCSDGYAAADYKQSPVAGPPGALGASFRVIRGGGSNEPRDCRSANRSREVPVYRYNNLGFRLALV